MPPPLGRGAARGAARGAEENERDPPARPPERAAMAASGATNSGATDEAARRTLRAVAAIISDALLSNFIDTLIVQRCDALRNIATVESTRNSVHLDRAKVSNLNRRKSRHTCQGKEEKC